MNESANKEIPNYSIMLNSDELPKWETSESNESSQWEQTSTVWSIRDELAINLKKKEKAKKKKYYRKKRWILTSLKDEYFTCYETTRFWVKCLGYSLLFPEVNWFKGKQIEFFVSKKEYSEEQYKKNKEWQSNSSTVEDISTKILEIMRDYLKEHGLSEDEGMNFVEELSKDEAYGCKTWNNIKKTTGLKHDYFLKDTEWDSCTIWSCCNWDKCCFRHKSPSKDSKARLLLWLEVEDRQ